MTLDDLLATQHARYADVRSDLREHIYSSKRNWEVRDPIATGWSADVPPDGTAAV